MLLRLVPKSHATSQFAALNLRLEELSKEVQRRRRAEELAVEQREWLRVTLASIGDAVLATDAEGGTFLNPVAEVLTGWPQVEAAGRPLTDVFRIVNEETRAPAENPVDRVLREGKVIGLANHTVLISRAGSETPIDDCAAPIRRKGEPLAGGAGLPRDHRAAQPGAGVGRAQRPAGRGRPAQGRVAGDARPRTAQPTRALVDLAHAPRPAGDRRPDRRPR